MNNMGGLRRLFYILAEDFVSLVKGLDDLYTLTLGNGAIITEIKFTHDTGKFTETEEETENGTAYNFEAAFRVPKCELANIDTGVDIGKKKVMILCEDNNDQFFLEGAPGSYFKLTRNSSTGTDTQDINSRQITVSASLASGGVYINSPL